MAITPDYAEIAKLCDLWLAPKQGTDAAMALAMGHVMLREFHLDKPSQYFTDYVRRYTDMPMLVMLEERDGYYAAGRTLRASDLVDSLGQEKNPEWKTVAFDEKGDLTVPNGSLGFRWGDKGKWNLEQRDGKTGEEIELRLSLLGSHDEVADVASRTSAAKVLSTSTKSLLKTFYCTNCRSNACSWPTAPARW